MKHLLLVLFAAFTGYVLWQLADQGRRYAAMKFIDRHTVPLALIVLAAVVLLVIARYVPSISLL